MNKKLDKITFTVGVILSSISHTRDRGIRLGFTTQELNKDERAVIEDQFQQYGNLLFSPNEIDYSDIPKEQAEDKSKTPSKRLRNVLYVLWKQTSKEKDFELYYRIRMEKIIDYVKVKLDGV